MKLLSRRFLTQYTLCALIFLSIDLLWTASVARKLYLDTLSPILSGQPAWAPVLAIYVIYPFGLWFFAIRPSTKPEDAALRGGILGLTTYSTYTLTSMSLFTGWTWALTLVDCAWGVILSAGVAYFIGVLSRLFPE